MLNINNNEQLSDLNGKSLLVSLTEIGFPLSFTVISTKVFVGAPEPSDSEQHHCAINTSLKTLKLLKQEQQLTALIKEDKLAVDGDLKVAQSFAALFENIDIDWQSEIAKHLGDIPTYQLSQFVAAIKQKAGFAASQISADASEWLLHEQRLVVSSAELAHFNDSVNHVVKSADALETKIAQLSNKISALAS